MMQVRCEICLLKIENRNLLIAHYILGHSKMQLAREMYKLSIRAAIPKILKKKRKNKTEKGSKTTFKATEKTETVFSNDSCEILCRNNEIIIRDDKSNVDMEFSFDENSNETKEICFEPVELSKSLSKIEINNNKSVNKGAELKKLKLKSYEDFKRMGPNMSSSSASSEDSMKKFSFRKRIRKRRDPRDKTRHFKINITRIRNSVSLNEETGNFYLCHCRGHNSLKGKSTELELTSDTESASDTSKANNFKDIKVFCSKCGNGYRDESLLMEHIKIHERHCRVCNEIFSTKHKFKQHIQTHMFKVFVCHVCNCEFPVKPLLHQHLQNHMEHSVLETVLDMEEDYNITPQTLVSDNYQGSISNILQYLSDGNHVNYYSSNTLSKVYCDICFTEVLCRDYKSHMQDLHRIYLP